MSTVAERFRTRVDLSLPTAGLFVGDLLAIATFVLVGEVSHNVPLVAAAPRVLNTYSQFLIGWLVFSVPAGAYRLAARTSIKQAVVSTAAAWAGGVVVAQTLRSTPYFTGDFAITFALVSLVVGGFLVVGWRTIAVFVTNRGRMGPA